MELDFMPETLDFFSKKKTQIKRTVFEKYSNSPIKWKDIKTVDLQDNDEIFSQEITSDEENTVSYYVIVSRWREETDEEFNIRQEHVKEVHTELKEKRYKQFLTLKKEFEPELNPEINPRH